MNKLFISVVLLLSGLQTAVAKTDVYASKDSGFSATVNIKISATTEGECLQKFNELVQKIEITNRIILDTSACKQDTWGSGEHPFYAHIFVANI